TATLPCAVAIGGQGWHEALSSDSALARGLNLHNGHVTNDNVADAFDLEAVSAAHALANWDRSCGFRVRSGLSPQPWLASRDESFVRGGRGNLDDGRPRAGRRRICGAHGRRESVAGDDGREAEVLLAQTTRRFGIPVRDGFDDRGVVGHRAIEELSGERIVPEAGVDLRIDVDGHAHELRIVAGTGDGEMELSIRGPGGGRLGASGVGVRQLPELGELVIGAATGRSRGEGVLEHG